MKNGKNDLSFEERRRFPRLKVEVDVEFKVLGELTDQQKASLENVVFENKTRDISPLGVCIATGTRIPEYALIELTFKFPGASCKGIGRVIWSRDIEHNGHYFSGIEFVAIDHNRVDRFANCIAEYYFEAYKDQPEKQKNLIKRLLKSVMMRLRTM